MTRWFSPLERIYMLVGSDGRPRYVGRTTYPLNERLDKHRCASTAAGRWVRSSRAVQIVCLEVTPVFFVEDVPQAGERERYWIERLRAEGHDLFNVWPLPRAA